MSSMGFKDMVAADLKNVFFNPDEFAEEHNLNGTVCFAVIEGVSTKERSARAAENYEGMFKSILVVHVRADDLPEVPPQGQIFKVDGKTYIVNTCNNDMGMLTIGLAANSIEC